MLEYVHAHRLLRRNSSAPKIKSFSMTVSSYLFSAARVTSRPADDILLNVKRRRFAWAHDNHWDNTFVVYACIITRVYFTITADVLSNVVVWILVVREAECLYMGVYRNELVACSKSKWKWKRLSGCVCVCVCSCRSTPYNNDNVWYAWDDVRKKGEKNLSRDRIMPWVEICHLYHWPLRNFT